MKYQTATDLAPCKPEDPIELRRWWNQICINALSLGIPSGCSKSGFKKSFSCSKQEHYICTRCNHRQEMDLFPSSAFIGFNNGE